MLQTAAHLREIDIRRSTVGMFEPGDILHPRPQLARDRWTDLRGPWRFAYDDSDSGLDDGWVHREDVYDRTIAVPFPPESAASGIGDTSFHPVVWYRRTFEMSTDERAGRLILHLGAVDYRAHVWVNGHLVATHEGGHTPFKADITTALSLGASQVIVIRAEDQPRDLNQPRGKQDWQEQPHSIWYHRTTGIWQPVWLESVGSVYLDALHWTPHIERSSLTVRARLRGRSEQMVRLRVRLTLRDILLPDDTYLVQGECLEREIGLDLSDTAMTQERVLWAPWHPNLIDATVTVISGEEVVDQVRSYAGLRSVGVEQGRFLFNGHITTFRMVLSQGYWPESHLAAPSDEAIYREVHLARQHGFTGVRLHQKVEDPRFLYWCDRLGLMVWGEMANAYVFSEEGRRRLTREWLEVLERDSSHPCIVAWVPINESWGVPRLPTEVDQRHFVEGLYHLTKSFDPTRPVIANDGWEYLCGDMHGIHDYTMSGDVIRHRYGSPEALERTRRHYLPSNRFVALSDGPAPDVPIVLSEFGGISYDTDDWNGHAFTYCTVHSPEEYLAKYRELVSAIMECPTLAGFCYTQLADTLQETNGLLTQDREPKLDPADVNPINTMVRAELPPDARPSTFADRSSAR
jgi:beta-galactosidase/beta-glucuronidase